MHSDAHDDPMARALGYPYPWHPAPVLFDPATGARDAHVIDLGPERERAIPGVDRPLPVRAVAVAVAGQTIEIDDTIALIAAGSNGSAVQLARKYRARREARPIVVAPARIAGALSVYSAHIASYGSVPATLHRPYGRHDAATASLPVLMMPVEELAHMNATESLGVNYVLAAPHAVRAAVGSVGIARPLAYVSKRGALALDGAPVRLPGTGAQASGLREAGQREMIARVMVHAAAEGTLEDFVTRMIQDADARLAVTSRLAERGERWSLTPDEIVAGGP